MLKKLAILLDPDSEMGGDQTDGDDARAHADAGTEGKTMEEFVRSQIGAPEKEEKSDAQKLGETEEEEQEQGLGADKQGEEKEEDSEAAEQATKDGKEKKEGEEEEKGDEDAEAEDGQAEKKGEEEGKGEAKEPVPYERFEEVNQKYRNVETELERTKPIAEAHQRIIDYCQQYNITADQFQKTLEIQALLNTNPEEALKRIMPIVEQVQGFTGDRLPADLQKKVDNGSLDLADAREMASLRAKAQFGTNRFDQYQKKLEEQQFQNTQRAMNSAMTTWVDSKLKSNPDFKPKKTEADPDGIYEFTVDRYLALVSKRDEKGQYVNPCVNAEQVTKLLERSYTEVTKAFRPALKPKTKPNLSSSMGARSSGKVTRPEDAKSMSEVVRLAASGRF